MDKNKLFDKISEELNHFCRFTCGKKIIIVNEESLYDIDCDECGNNIDVINGGNTEVDLCEHCQLKSFVEVLKREIQVDKL